MGVLNHGGIGAGFAVVVIVVLMLSAGLMIGTTRSAAPPRVAASIPPDLRTGSAPDGSAAVAGTSHVAHLVGITHATRATATFGSSPVPATSAPLVTAITVGKHFPGLSFANTTCSCAPPDVQTAVGKTDVVEMANTAGKIWSKAGANLSWFPLTKLFTMPSTDFISDPKVLYDNVSGRWFASILDVTNDSVYVAVSTTGTPTGSWFVYIVPPLKTGQFPDQPILGVDNNLVVIGGNQFHNTGGFTGGALFALNKSSMMAGATTYYSAFGPNLAWFSQHPVHSISSTTTEFVVMTSGSPSLKVWKLTGTPSATTSAHLSAATTLTLSAYSTPPPAPQKGTTKKVDTSDNRVQDAVWRAGVLWLTFGTGCIPTGDSSTRSCVRLTQLSTGLTITVGQDFNLARALSYVYYGALALDGSLNLGVVYSYSNATTFPVIAATGHLSSSASGTLLASVTLVKGTASFTASFACNGGSPNVCRWGDYYGAGADPSTANLWVAGEYCVTTTLWSTWISSIKV